MQIPATELVAVVKYDIKQVEGLKCLNESFVPVFQDVLLPFNKCLCSFTTLLMLYITVPKKVAPQIIAVLLIAFTVYEMKLVL